MKGKRGLIQYIALLIIIVIGLMLIGGSLSTLSFVQDTADFTYTHDANKEPLNIGNKQFVPESLRYVCDDYSDSEVRYPEPRPDCWKSTVSFDEKKYELTAERALSIHPNIRVILKPQGKVVFDSDAGLFGDFENDDDWKSVYDFDIDNRGLLNSTAVNIPQYVELGENQDFIIEIENNLASFNENHAGAWLRFRHNLLERGETWQTRKFNINEGQTKYLISPDTSELGKVTMGFQPFIEIKADKLVTLRQSEPIMLQYEVVMQAPGDTGEAKVTEPSFLMKFWDWISINLLGWLY